MTGVVCLPSYIPSQDLSCAPDDLIMVGENRSNAADNVTEVATNRCKVINDYGSSKKQSRSMSFQELCLLEYHAETCVVSLYFT